MRAGDVVLMPFPFSDQSGAKVRPAVVLADVGRDDFVVLQVTSNRDADPLAIELPPAGFAAGGLRVTSYVRPGKLATSHHSVFVRRVGQLTDQVRDQIKEAVVDLIRRG